MFCREDSLQSSLSAERSGAEAVLTCLAPGTALPSASVPAGLS